MGRTVRNDVYGLACARVYAIFAPMTTSSMKALFLVGALTLGVHGATGQDSFERYYPLAGALNGQGGIIDAEGYPVLVAVNEADVVVLRLQPNGDLDWLRRYALFTEEGLYGPALVSTTEGIFVAGYTMGMGTAARDGLLLHLGFDGSLISSKRYDVAGGSNAFHSVLPSGNGFIAAGRSTPAANSYDMSITSFDAAGELQWSRSYGSSQWDWGYQALALSNGGYALVGYGDGLVSQTAAYVVKTAADGTELWARSISSTAADEGYTVAEDGEGNLYIGGRSLGMGVTPPSVSGFVTKLGPTGTHLWTRVLPNSIEVASLQPAAGGGVTWLARPQNISGGFGGYDVGWGVLDADGNAVVTKIFGGTQDDYVQTMVPIPGGGWFLMGSTNSFGSGWALHVLRINEMGESSCSGADWDLAWQSFTPNVQSFTSSTASGISEAAITLTVMDLSGQEMDPCCSVDPAFTISSTTDPYSWNFTSTGSGTMHSWDFGDGATASEASPSHTYASNGSYEVCHTVTTDCGDATECQQLSITVGIAEHRSERPRVYPVPATTEVVVETEGTPVVRATLFDAQGRQLWSRTPIRSERMLLSVAELMAGAYWLEVRYADGASHMVPVVIAH